MGLKVPTIQFWEITSIQKGNWISIENVNAQPLLFHSQVVLDVILGMWELTGEELVTLLKTGNCLKCFCLFKLACNST